MSVPSSRADADASNGASASRQRRNLIDAAFQSFCRMRATTTAPRAPDRTTFFAGATAVLSLVLADKDERETVELLASLIAETGGRSPELSPH